MKASRESKIDPSGNARKGCFAKIKVPVGWDATEFSEVFEFLPTNSFSREDMSYEIKANSYFNIHYGDIHATFDEQILDFKKHINQIPVLIHAPKNIDKDSFLKDGDLIIADASEDYAGVGECIEIVNINGRKVLSGLHTIAARDKTGRTQKGFRAYLLNHPQVSINLKRIATGSKVYGISKANIAGLTLIIPPLPEQKNIALILSTWDRAIEKTEQLIAQKQKLKKGLMQLLLTGKVRFKEFVKSKKMKKTKLGMVPEDWGFGEIGNLIDFLSGFPFESSGYAKQGIRLLRGSNIKRGNTDWSPDITQFWATETEELKPYKLKATDIVIAMDGSLVGRSFAQLTKADLPALLLQRVARIRASKIEIGFLKEYIGSDYFIDYCDSIKTVTAIPHISSSDIKKFSIALPSAEEQKRIAVAMSTLERQIQLLHQSHSKLKIQKSGLMQQLLTGKIRVKI